MILYTGKNDVPKALQFRTDVISTSPMEDSQLVAYTSILLMLKKEFNNRDIVISSLQMVMEKDSKEGVVSDKIVDDARKLIALLQ